MLTVSGATLSLKKGDKIISINGHKVADIIDFRFYQEAENWLKIGRQSRFKKLSASANELRKLSFVKDVPAVKRCLNKCNFCFVDQLPAGLRKSLYFKDDDWRLSFLTGNFITLTNLNQKQIERIVEQRVSPLYISLHAADAARRQLLGLRNNKNVMSKLSALDNAGITTHIQIVLCPGINDGVVLKRTLAALKNFKNVKSVGLVSVGLTKYHRNGLKSFTPNKAQQLISQVEPLQARYRKVKKLNWIYLADEIYLMAGMRVPNAAYYDNFDQLENGIGLVRNWLDGVKEAQLEIRNEKLEIERFVVVTGKLFAPMLKEALNSLSLPFKIKVQVIKNNFFGLKITVTGLIAGQDIIEQVKPTKDSILIPDVMVNEDKLFLDNLSFGELKNHLPNAYLVPSTAEGFIDWLKKAETTFSDQIDHENRPQ